MPTGARLGDATAAAVTTVVAAAGYPRAPEHGAEITIPPELEGRDDLLVFHAGTASDERGRLRVAGGRVLALTATGASVAEAAAKSRAAAEAVSFAGKQFRRDIGWREIARRS
jgi:phosphoribosylamine--glycine ligase